MKRRDLENRFKRKGWRFHKHGSRHDIWTNGTKKEQIPRHTDVNENLANALIKKWGL